MVRRFQAAHREQERRLDLGQVAHEVVAVVGAVLVEIRAGAEHGGNRDLRLHQLLVLARGAEVLGLTHRVGKNLRVGPAELGLVVESRRAAGDGADDARVRRAGHVVGSLYAAQAVSPEQDVLETARLQKVEPGGDVEPAVVDDLEAATETAVALQEGVVVAARVNS